MMKRAAEFHWLVALTYAALMLCAWLYVENNAGAVCGWAGTLCIVIYSGHSGAKLPYLPLYAAQCLLSACAFYWLFGTISIFGGFSFVPAALVFGLFVLASATQTILFVFLVRYLPKGLGAANLRLGPAWIACEYLAPRIFPWEVAHTQISFHHLIQIADIGGSPLVTLLIFSSLEAFYGFFTSNQSKLLSLPPLVLLAASLWYGSLRLRTMPDQAGASFEVALIQANITIEEKHNQKLVVQNEQRYRELTQAVAKDGLFVVWPESVLQQWVYTGVGSVEHDSRLPRFSARVGLLTGALTYSSETQLYNSALAILPDGGVPEPYHKQVLMPFGEYTPFARIVPWLKELNANVGEFTAGDQIEVFDYQLQDLEQQPVTVGVAPLICYDDLMPRLAREAVMKGATLLVNLTNDAWFGSSRAPIYHNIMAAFRALENRRYLLRATNTGLTAVISPLGETLSQLPLFSEGTLLARVKVISYKTLYTRYIGEFPWWMLTFGCFAYAIGSIVFAKVFP